ncbi:unnamed protein product [Miscanthus lutarioriparius]|uniref:Uncharacterized protein n=1 Tax=Miscanthus lutarioriparius TaxID=422564 RepID=A0A811RPX4_9POAL|nr:unnamed protein product [Miscanthus lutarioriparius]
MPNPPAASVAPAATYPTTSKPYAAPSMQLVPSPAPKPVQNYNSYISQTYTGLNMATDARMNGNQRPKRNSSGSSQTILHAGQFVWRPDRREEFWRWKQDQQVYQHAESKGWWPAYDW